MAAKPASRTRKAKDNGERGASSKKILTVDIGGSKIKILATGQTAPRKIPSSKNLTPLQMVRAVQKLAKGWEFDAVSIGYPGLVGDNGPRSEPGNLGTGWVGFNFAAAFALPVRIVNDAAMQALGSYEGGRMLFLGLGTGLGSTLIAENVIVPLELGQLKYNGKGSFVDVAGEPGLKQLGKKAWRKAVIEIATTLADALVADTVVLGGGNAKRLGVLPHGMRVGGNQTAFRGGFRLWRLADIRTHSAKTEHHAASSTASASEWRMI
ncbi:MAG: ROK family protein [Burkholderiales bacterium]